MQGDDVVPTVTLIIGEPVQIDPRDYLACSALMGKRDATGVMQASAVSIQAVRVVTGPDGSHHHTEVDTV